MFIGGEEMKYSILDLDSSEINTLVELIEFAIDDIGHACLKETPTEKSEKEYLKNLREKVDKC